MSKILQIIRQSLEVYDDVNSRITDNKLKDAITTIRQYATVDEIIVLDEILKKCEQRKNQTTTKK